MMSDIESMFYQVHVRPDDSKFLRYLWWPDGDLNRDPEEFQMLVHLFGGISSPSCANYALQRTADDNATKYDKETIYTIRNNFYVDDCLKSVETEDKALQLVDELRELLKKGGFNLTKWVSNSRKVIKAIPETQRACSVTDLDLDHLPIERALGLQWDVERDVFKFKATITSKPATRRGILSMTSSIYDPLGFISPYVLPAKFILQDLCRQGFGWDDPVPEREQERWNQWLEELPKLKELEVNRCLKPKSFGEVVSAELHNFSDASQLGYGAVSYLRLVNGEGIVHCAFIMGKSRLTPIKQVTIPRLELAAAVIATRLSSMIIQEIDMTIYITYSFGQTDLNSHLESSRATICIHVDDGGKYNTWPTPSGGDGFENIFLNYNEMIVSPCTTITRAAGDKKDDVEHQKSNMGLDCSDECAPDQQYSQIQSDNSKENDYYLEPLECVPRLESGKYGCLEPLECVPRVISGEYGYLEPLECVPRVVSGEYGYLEPLGYVPRDDIDEDDNLEPLEYLPDVTDKTLNDANDPAGKERDSSGF
ncbi:hypothetical protein QZH41_014920, partial [Actinostola sp. cb2023]